MLWRYTSRPYYDIGQNAFVADNKPYGAVISYYLKPHAVIPSVAKRSRGNKTKKGKKAPPKEKVTIEIIDASGKVVRHLDGSAAGGVNRVVWDLSTDPPNWPHTKQDPRPFYVFYPLEIDGPEVLPGAYTVRIHARKATLSVPLRVRLDPANDAGISNLRAQYDTLARLAADQERGEVWLAQLKNRGPKAAALADELRNGNGTQNSGYRQPAKVIDQIAYLRHIVASAYEGPTDAQAALMKAYEQQLDTIGKKVQALPPAPRKRKAASHGTRHH